MIYLTFLFKFVVFLVVTFHNKHFQVCVKTALIKYHILNSPLFIINHHMSIRASILNTWCEIINNQKPLDPYSVTRDTKEISLHNASINMRSKAQNFKILLSCMLH